MPKLIFQKLFISIFNVIQPGNLTSSCSYCFTAIGGIELLPVTAKHASLACRASIILGVSVYAGNPSNISCRL